MSFAVGFRSLIACKEKCFANESEESPLFAEVTVSLKCCVNLFLSLCCVHPM